MWNKGNIYYAVKCEGLTKKFGATFTAVDNVSLKVEKGMLFGLIGADGAGKTTLIRMLTTLLKPNEGYAEVLGLDVVKKFRTLRHLIGYMPGRFSLYTDLTVNENLKVFATLYGTTVKENYALFADIYEQLAPFGKRKAGKLSGGMKQKLALCCALVHRPEILFLDEPTTGVDPVSRKVFWDILSRLRTEERMPIIVSTPYMDEALRCDKVALMQDGKIISSDAPNVLINSYPYPLYGVASQQKGALQKFLRSLKGINSTFSFGDLLHITIDPNAIDLNQIERKAKLAGFTDIKITPITPTIEDYFLAQATQQDNE